jgi:hypothetical protein
VCEWWRKNLFSVTAVNGQAEKKKRTGGRERTANLPEESTTLNRLRRADTPMNKTNKANTTTNTFADDNRSSTTPIIKHKTNSTQQFPSVH